MTVHMGPLGALHAIKCPASMTTDTSETVSTRTTLEGATRVQLVNHRAKARTWALDITAATPDTIVALGDLAWSPGPYVFVPADAPAVNMLSPATAIPDATMWGGAVAGGSVRTGGALSMHSLANATPTQPIFCAEKVPVLPGEPVTFAADVLGSGALVRVTVRSATGDVLVSAASRMVGSTAQYTRAWATIAAVPAGGAWADIQAENTQGLARPAVTWATTPGVRAEGRGCPAAVLVSDSRDTQWAATSPGGARERRTITVQEVKS